MGTPIRGRLGLIEVGSGPVVLNETKSWEYTREGTEEDTSILGLQRVDIVNVKVTGTVVMYAQSFPGTVPAQDAGQALLKVNDVVPMTIYPNGLGSGKPQLDANIKVKSEKVGASSTTFTEQECTFEIDGADDWTPSTQA